jgi:hypothetical protein
MSGELGRAARGRGQGGKAKAAPSLGKGGKRGGKGKTRYVITIRCLSLSGSPLCTPGRIKFTI